MTYILQHKRIPAIYNVFRHYGNKRYMNKTIHQRWWKQTSKIKRTNLHKPFIPYHKGIDFNPPPIYDRYSSIHLKDILKKTFQESVAYTTYYYQPIQWGEDNEKT